MNGGEHGGIKSRNRNVLSDRFDCFSVSLGFLVLTLVYWIYNCHFFLWNKGSGAWTPGWDNGGTVRVQSSTRDWAQATSSRLSLWLRRENQEDGGRSWTGGGRDTEEDGEVCQGVRGNKPEVTINTRNTW